MDKLHEKRVRFEVIATLDAEPTEDDYINEHSTADLKVYPAGIADLFLDAAGEPNKEGCEIFVRVVATAVTTMAKYMEIQGWESTQDFMERFIITLNDFIERSGRVGLRQPPPGGIAG